MKGKAPRRRAHTSQERCVSILRTAALATAQDMTTETGSAVNYQGVLGRLLVWLYLDLVFLIREGRVRATSPNLNGII